MMGMSECGEIQEKENEEDPESVQLSAKKYDEIKQPRLRTSGGVSFSRKIKTASSN